MNKLRQESLFKGSREFVIQDEETVVAKYHEPGLDQELVLTLAHINPNPTRQKHRAAQMIVGMLFFLLPTLGFLWLAITAEFGSNKFFWFAGTAAVFALPSFLCWREYIRQSFDVQIFEEHGTGNRVVLHQDVPSRADVEGFVESLQKAIEDAKESKTDSSSESAGSLSAELEKLADLKKRGVLTDTEFLKAKTNLLEAQEPPRKIGFHSR